MMNTNQGFTLVELVVTLVVVLVLLAVGIPAFTTMLANNRAAADSNTLVTALQLARSEAVKRRGRVSVCSGNATTAAAPTPNACSGSDDWTNGFMVVLNSVGSSGAWTPAAGDMLRVWDRFKGQVSATATHGAGSVDFAPDGRALSGVCVDLQRTGGSGAQARRWLGVDTLGRTQVSSDKADVQPCN